MNRITAKQFQELKNKEYAVIFFESTSSTRDLFMGFGYGLPKILEAIEQRQKHGLFPVIITNPEHAKKITALESDGKTGITHRRVTFGEVQRILKEV